MDVSSKLVIKRTGEEGPEIKGGHPDALIVHSIKPTKGIFFIFHKHQIYIQVKITLASVTIIIINNLPKL